MGRVIRPLIASRLRYDQQNVVIVRRNIARKTNGRGMKSIRQERRSWNYSINNWRKYTFTPGGHQAPID